MKIIFADKKMAKLVNNDRKMEQTYGTSRAQLLRRRLAQLQDACNLEEVKYLPGHYHELTNDRKGQWGCDLDQPYRLVFTAIEKPIPTNEHGKYIWIKITGIEIVEIINYHKEK